MKKLLILMFAAMLLVGCSPKDSAPDTTSPSSGTEATLAPEWEWLLEEPSGPEATTAVLELTEQSLTESLEFYFLLNRNGSDAAYLDSIAETRSFRITAFSQEDDIVTADVSVTVPDVYAIITTMGLDAYATAEETDAALSSAIKAATPLEKQVTIQFTPGVNRWEPVMDDAVADVFYGGLIGFLNESMEGGA